jgi:hypothetical protein
MRATRSRRQRRLRCFILAAPGEPLDTLLSVLSGHGVQIVSVSTSRVHAEVQPPALPAAMLNADFVVFVLPPAEPDPALLAEATAALEASVPVAVIARRAAVLPRGMAPAFIVWSDPEDRAALSFALGHFIENGIRSGSLRRRAQAGTSDACRPAGARRHPAHTVCGQSGPLAEAADDARRRAEEREKRRMRRERSAAALVHLRLAQEEPAIVRAVAELVGVSTEVALPEPDWGGPAEADLAIWVDGLPRDMNPVLVDVRQVPPTADEVLALASQRRHASSGSLIVLAPGVDWRALPIEALRETPDLFVLDLAAFASGVARRSVPWVMQQYRDQLTESEG